MWLADRWKDYEVLDTSSGEKLERWGNYILVRPDPQVIWNTPHDSYGWKKKNAHYHRSDKGGGRWEFFDLPEQWTISYDLKTGGAGDKTNTVTDDAAGSDGAQDRLLTFNLKPFQFKHTGLFPEQAVNWDWMAERIISSGKKLYHRGGGKSDVGSIPGDRTGGQSHDFGDKDSFKVLNLFAYTGGATAACLKAGAQVTHVDASKGMVGWAKENAASSGLADAPVRFFVDDCVKLVERELRRGNHYDGILMDPPSYGRGPKGEIWKLEEKVYELISLTSGLLSDDASFFLINSYTTGLQPAVLDHMLKIALKKDLGGRVEADEVGLPVTDGLTDGLILPCGATGRWFRE